MLTYLAHPLWKLIALGQVLVAFGLGLHFASSFLDFVGVFVLWVGIFLVIDAVVMHFVKPAVAVDVTPAEAVTKPFVAEAPFPPESTSSTLHVVPSDSGKDSAL